jgi:type II secretory pathway pseudopilin PulG
MNVKDTNTTRANSGFTLVEIAISIAVVAFALVAIIGVLPTGLQVQKENRQETSINQDAPLLLEAIRTGATNVHNLAANLEYIQTRFQYGPTFDPYYPVLTGPLPTGAVPTGFNTAFGLTPRTDVTGLPGSFSQYEYHSGARDIIGHLSWPRNLTNPPPFTGTAVINVSHRARFLANSGGSLALEADKARKLAFSYIVTCEIIPHTRIGSPPGSGLLSRNLYDIRLVFQWPVIGPPDPVLEKVGRGRKVFRTTVAGQLLPAPDTDPAPGNQSSNYFFHPFQYGRIQP